MTRWIRSGALLVVLLAVPLTVLLTATTVTGSSTAGAQTGGRLELVGQTLFVDEAPVEIVVRVSGAGEGASLEVTIYRAPLQTLDELRSSWDEPPAGGSRLSFFQCPLDEACDQADVVFGAGGLTTITLREDEIGEALRFNSGALSMAVRLLDDGGEELDAFTTSLLVLDDAAPPAPVRVAFVGRVDAPLALQPDQSLALDAAHVLEAAAHLEARPDLPVAVELRPETIDSLSQVDPDALTHLLTILGDRSLLRAPWVEMDEEAWRAADAADVVVAQYALGHDTLENVTGTSPTEWIRLDADAGPETLGLLRTVGAGAVIVADEQVTTPGDTLTLHQPFRLVDDNGVAITAVRIDAGFHATLDDPDAELGGYRALAELVVAAHEASTDLGVLLDFDRLDPVALDVLLGGIDDRPELEVVDLTELLELEPARSTSGQPIRGELVQRLPDNVASLAAELRAAGTAVDTLATMVEPETGPITPLRTQLLAAVSADLTVDEARLYADAVFDDVLAGTSGFRIAPSDRITLTDRRTDLPLTIINGQPLPINVDILLSAEKLRFPDGERLTRTLQPGENRLVIRVETLASGDARVTARLTSPGGLFELGSGTVDIRSTAISGLGLIISIVALVILGAWWIRTILRVRRNRAAATVSAASDNAMVNTAVEEPIEEPVEEAVEETGPTPTEGEP